MQTHQLLSPQLYVIVALFVLFTAVVCVAAGLILSRLAVIERRFGPPIPLFKHLQGMLSGELMHPHGFAVELDALMREKNRAPEIPMTPERHERLKELMRKRAASDNPQLRNFEQDTALLYLLIQPFVDREVASPIKLTGLVLVGSRAPTKQTAGEKSAAQGAQ